MNVFELFSSHNSDYHLFWRLLINLKRNWLLVENLRELLNEISHLFTLTITILAKRFIVNLWRRNIPFCHDAWWNSKLQVPNSWQLTNKHGLIIIVGCKVRQVIFHLNVLLASSCRVLVFITHAHLLILLFLRHFDAFPHILCVLDLL